MENRAVKGILEQCAEVCGLDHVIFIGYHFENLAYIRTFAPEVNIQLLVRNHLAEEQIQNLEVYRFGLDAHHEILSPELIQQLHARSIVVNCWTIDDPLRAEELISWGVDQITSNILENTQYTKSPTAWNWYMSVPKTPRRNTVNVGWEETL